MNQVRERSKTLHTPSSTYAAPAAGSGETRSATDCLLQIPASSFGVAAAEGAQTAARAAGPEVVAATQAAGEGGAHPLEPAKHSRKGVPCVWPGRQPAPAHGKWKGHAGWL
jgi:hypothetical protein